MKCALSIIEDTVCGGNSCLFSGECIANKLRLHTISGISIIKDIMETLETIKFEISDIEYSRLEKLSNDYISKAKDIIS
jgi:hypothetical protein